MRPRGPLLRADNLGTSRCGGAKRLPRQRRTFHANRTLSRRLVIRAAIEKLALVALGPIHAGQPITFFQPGAEVELAQDFDASALAWVCAGPLGSEHASLGVNRDRSRAAGVLHEHGHRIVPIQLADAVGLLLCEQHAAVGGTDNAVRVVGALPDERPAGTGRQRRRGWP